MCDCLDNDSVYIVEVKALPFYLLVPAPVPAHRERRYNCQRKQSVTDCGRCEIKGGGNVVKGDRESYI